MKRSLSFLLALVMLLSIIPMTALAAAAAAAEAAATGETYGVSTGDGLLAMLEKDTLPGDVMTINVNADISYYVTTQGVTGIDSFLRYACTLGQGKKILNLNGHKLHFYNDYVVIDACSGYSASVINNLNRQCLFEIPSGADLTVNGDAKDSIDSGLIQYHGKLFEKCDAVDQRDIFAIRGGNLTINSGCYLAGGESVSYKLKDQSDFYYKLWYLVGGDAIRAMSGNLTVNGGYFEGRGLSGYTDVRNEALYAEAGMSSVVINDGHFKGRSCADAVRADDLIRAGRFTVNAGIFELEKYGAAVGTGVIYHNLAYAVFGSGRIGVFFPNHNIFTSYYYKEEPDGDYIKVQTESLENDAYHFFRFSDVYLVFVDPNNGTGMSHPTSGLDFRIGGTKHEYEDIDWRKGDPTYIYVDPDSLYFEDQQMSSYGVEQSMSPTVTFKLFRYLGDDGPSSAILENQSVDLSRDSSGHYYINLNNLAASVKNELAEDETYRFLFTATENWKSRRSFSIRHDGNLLVTISSSVERIYCYIDEPEYGEKSTADVDYYYSRNCCEINLVGWTYKTSESDSWHTMDSSDTFTRDKIYAANFVVNMKDGYTLADNAKLLVGERKATVVYQNSGGLIAYIEFDMRADPIRIVGDFDGDGEITVADALAALRIAAKLAAETYDSVQIGDTDGDGHVTVSDALAILRVAAKLADRSSLG